MKFSTTNSVPSPLVQFPKHSMECESLHSHSFPQTSTFNHYQTGFQQITETEPNRIEPMVPNLDLLALACLHGSFIAVILLIIVFIVLVVFFLSSSLALFSVFVGDLYGAYSVLCVYYEEVKAEIELGASLMVYGVMGFGVDVVLGVKSLFRQQNLRFTIRLPQKKVKEKWGIGMHGKP